MTYFPISTNSEDRSGKSIVPVRMRNVLLTPLPEGSRRGRGVAAIPRPGLVKRCTPSPGDNLRGLFHQPGFHGSVLYAIAGGALFAVDSAWNAVAIGAVTDATDLAQMDALLSSLVIVAGGDIFDYDSVSLTQNTDAHAPSPAQSLCIFGSRVVSSQTNTDIESWSAVGNALSWPALGFASSEAKADPVLANVVAGTVLLSFGSVTTQAFNAVGGPDESAIQVDSTYSREIGLLARDAIDVFDEGILFVSRDKDGNRTPAMMAGLQPTRIINHGLVARLAALTDTQAARLKTFGLGWLDKKLWVVCVPDGKPAMTYDLTTRTWAEWTSFESARLKMDIASPFGAAIVVADSSGDALYTLEADAYTDDGDPIECVMGFHVPVSGPAPINTITLDIKCHGQPLTDGDGAPYAPKARVRYYFDGGSIDSVTEWADERVIDLPEAGNYDIPAPETRFGLARGASGILIEISITEPMGWAMHGIWVNEWPE